MLHAQDIRDVLVLAPQAMTNSATATANLDRMDSSGRMADYATITIGLASEINTNAVGPLLSVLDSDTTDSTNFATITADRTAEAIVTAKIVEYHIDCRARKRYLRLSVSTDTTTNDNVTVCAVGKLSRLRTSPASTSDIADAVVIL